MANSFLDHVIKISIRPGTNLQCRDKESYRNRGKVKRLNRGKRERTKERRQNGFGMGGMILSGKGSERILKKRRRCARERRGVREDDVTLNVPVVLVVYMARDIMI